jgi:ABC-type multidrug transport system fused ATPase/permease subunit
LTLSGGERQRLAVARALIRQAPLLILDEATANLDTRSEADLLALLHERCAGRGVLMITHRLVAMERMWEIVVLDHGRVVERGSHARLSAADGLYRQLLEAQRQVIVAP